MAICSLIGCYQHFDGTCCLCLQGRHLFLRWRLLSYCVLHIFITFYKVGNSFARCVFVLIAEEVINPFSLTVERTQSVLSDGWW